MAGRLEGLVEDALMIVYDLDGRRCRVCGCTEDAACPGGCFWVEYDLCSACVIAGTVRRPAGRVTR